MRVLIRVLPTLAAVIVAAASFALSYVALRDVAAETAAVPADLAWLVPICVDGAVLAGSATLWSSSLRGQRKDPVAVLTVVSLLVISVVINVNHAGPDLLAKVIAALPPLTLLACLEMVASQYRREAEAAAELEDDPERADRPARDTAAPTEAPVAAPAVPAKGLTPVGAAELPTRDPVPAPVVPSPPATATRVTELAPDPAEARSGEPASFASWSAADDAAVAEASARALSPAREPDAAATDVSAAPAPAPIEPSVPTSTPAPTPTPAPSAAPAPAPAPAPTPAPVTSAAKARAAKEPSGADRIRHLFQEHLNAGGSATDPTLTRKFAADLKLEQAYVRKVLGPLRRELEPAT